MVIIFVFTAEYFPLVEKLDFQILIIFT